MEKNCALVLLWYNYYFFILSSGIVNSTLSHTCGRLCMGGAGPSMLVAVSIWTVASLSCSSSTSLGRQLGALFQDAYIHSQVMLYIASSNPICLLCCWCCFHWEILSVVCVHFVWKLQLLWGNSSILWLHSILHNLLVLWCPISSVYPWMYAKERLLDILFHHVLLKVVLHMHFLMHLCRLCIILMDPDSIG